ncbi:MAG: FkbM family methyltransferase [Betaproteobacteria bacterium]
MYITTFGQGTWICVPDNLTLLTPYVLLEQEDWFEDEIKFLRKVIGSGQKVVDIGANYGVYALSLAHVVGPSGQVVCFEPSSLPAEHLEQSIRENGFGNVVLDRRGLSNVSGHAHLTAQDNAELNHITREEVTTGAVERIEITTLDEAMVRHALVDVDFLKIDAEGEESNILRGGRAFLDRNSPLVLFEIKDGSETNIGLMDEFRALGFQIYRLVPGLDLLVPWDESTPLDLFQLNLFGCKPDRAGILRQGGWLLETLADADEVRRGLEDAYRSLEHASAYWDAIATYQVFESALLPTWMEHESTHSPVVRKAIYLQAISRDTAREPAERFHALDYAFQLIASLCATDPSRLRRSTAARVALELGHRNWGTHALQVLMEDISRTGRLDMVEPFLLPSLENESAQLTDWPLELPTWVRSCILEAEDRNRAFSSYFEGTATLENLRSIQALGYASPETLRRIELIQRRFGLI